MTHETDRTPARPAPSEFRALRPGLGVGAAAGLAIAAPSLLTLPWHGEVTRTLAGALAATIAAAVGGAAAGLLLGGRSAPAGRRPRGTP
ncbi:MAG: hypothetical protein AB7P02_19060 [Alphaproteobacteria bacterium]